MANMAKTTPAMMIGMATAWMMIDVGRLFMVLKGLPDCSQA